MVTADLQIITKMNVSRCIQPNDNSDVEYFNDTTVQLQKQQLNLEQNMKKITKAVEKLQGKVQRIEQRLMLPHSLNEVLQYIVSTLMTK